VTKIVSSDLIVGTVNTIMRLTIMNSAISHYGN
jgi:hypothetical protein